jgi:hypothetical protein
MRSVGHGSRWLVAGILTLLAGGAIVYALSSWEPEPTAGPEGPLSEDEAAPPAAGGEKLYPPPPAAEGEAEAQTASASDDGARFDLGEEAGDAKVAAGLEAARDRTEPEPENPPPLRGKEERADDAAAPPERRDLAAQSAEPGPDRGPRSERPSDLAEDRISPSPALPDAVLDRVVRGWRAPERCGLEIGEGAPGTMELEFVVGRDGRPRTPRARRVDGEREAAYARCLERSLATLRFPELPEPVKTSATFVF